MIQSKFLIDYYKKLRKLFGDDEPEDTTTESKLHKLESKVKAFRVYADIISEQVEVNKEMMEVISAQLKTVKEKGNLIHLSMQREYLLLKKETIDFEIDYFSKMDFVGHYNDRVRYFQPFHEEYVKSVNENIEKVVKQLESALPHIPVTSSDKRLAAGILNDYYNNVKTQEQKVTAYRKITDLFQNIKIFIPK